MDERLRLFVTKILKGMITEGRSSSDIRRYAFARLQDNSITADDLFEIDVLIEERDNPVIIETSEEVESEEPNESEVEE